MKNKISVFAASAVLFVMPMMVSAQGTAGTDGTDGIGSLITTVGGWVSSLLPILLTLGVLAFFWGLTQYLFKIGGSEGAKSGKDIMIYGILAVFVMASIGGIVGLLQKNTGTQNGNNFIKPPCISGADCPET